jgi:hypothetical protein
MTNRNAMSFEVFVQPFYLFIGGVIFTTINTRSQGLKGAMKVDDSKELKESR